MDFDHRWKAGIRHEQWAGGLLLAAGTVGILLAAVTLLAANRQLDRPFMFGTGVAGGAVAALVATRPGWRPQPTAWLAVPVLLLAGTVAGLLWSQQSVASDGYCLITTYRGAPFEWLGSTAALESGGPGGPVDVASCGALPQGEAGLGLLPAGLVLDLLFWAYVGLLVAVVAGFARRSSPLVAAESSPDAPAAAPEYDEPAT